MKSSLLTTYRESMSYGSFHPETVLFRNLCVNQRTCLCDVPCTSPRNTLIFLILQKKIARFLYENCTSQLLLHSQIFLRWHK